MKRVIHIIIAFCLFFSCILFLPLGSSSAKMTGIIALMAYLWITEAIPLPVTALIPVILFPLLNITTLSEVTQNYSKPIIYLFLGGFILALGIEKSNLHKRLALSILSRIGGNPVRLILGFMLTVAFLSMWISNTAAVMVMFPIALSVVKESVSEHIDEDIVSRFATALFLSIAYAANVGGMATLIGTAPNMVFKEIYETSFPQRANIDFTWWMMMATPLVVIFLLVIWKVFTKFLFPLPSKEIIEKNNIENELEKLGKFTADEKKVSIVFLLAVVLWVTGSDIQTDWFTVYGWRTLLGLKEVTDPVVAVFCAALMFIIPSSANPQKGLVEWKDAVNIPWGILLLFGGGFAIAQGFHQTGLSETVVQLFSTLTLPYPWLFVILTSLVITFLTELTSNTAVTTLTLPVLASVAAALKTDPLYLMLPATLSASCAFMMPTATPPQAIVFGSGFISMRQMNKAGFVINIIGVILISSYLLLFLG